MKANIPAIYIGRRLNSDGPLVQVFKVGEETRLFKGIKWVTIGRTYLIAKDGCPIRPECVREDQASAKDIEKWEVEESIDVQEDKRRKLAARFSSDPRFLADFQALARVCQGLNSFERARLVEFLVDKLSRANTESTLKTLRKDSEEDIG